MTNMAQTRELVEQFLTEIPQDVRSTALLIALLQKLGITDTKELAKLCRVSRRMVQIAAKQTSPPAKPASPSSETHCAEAKPISPKTKPVSPSEMDCAPRAPARAHFDTNLSCEEAKIDTPPPSVVAPAEKPRRIGTRLPEDWTLPEDWRQWARMNFATVPPQAIEDQAERFHDFWIAKPGKGGTKLDWFATWRNWTRESFTPAKRSAQPMNWGRNAYDQQPKSGINWDAVDARVAELDRRVAGGRFHA